MPAAYLGPVLVLFALGGLFLVVGIIWLGQGVGLIGGSFMTGEALWALVGAVCIVVRRLPDTGRVSLAALGFCRRRRQLNTVGSFRSHGT